MMDKEKRPERKSPRLKNFDYSNNRLYFVTICTHNKIKILSNIKNNNVILTDNGIIVDKFIKDLNNKYPSIKIIKYVIMPNHIHLIVKLYKTEKSVDLYVELNDAMAWLKYLSTKEINRNNNVYYKKIFQRSFQDHIIRCEKDYEKIWNYINNNPYLWNRDCFYL